MISLPIVISAQESEFIQGNIPRDEIIEKSEINWQSFSTPLYMGTQNGVYWLRFRPAVSTVPFVISIPEAHVTRAHLMTTSGDSMPAMSDTRKITFLVESIPEDSLLLMRVLFRKEAIISLNVQTLTEYLDQQSSETVYLGLYYGIVFIVILTNLFSYIHFQRKTYLHYVIMLSLIAAGLAAADGYARLFFESELLQVYLEPFLNLCVALALAVLANSYMDLNRHLPQINKVGWILGALSVALFLTYLFTDDFFAFALAELTALALVTSYWLAGAIIFNKSLAARIFTIAYFLICFSCYDYYIARSFGFKLFGLSLDQFRIGAIVEMLVFTYAINYQGKLLAVENRRMRNQLLKFSMGDEGQRLLSDEADRSFMNDHHLTPKEVHILKRVSEGKINKEIAEELNISVNTVKFHIKNIYGKLKTSTRQEAREKYFSMMQKLAPI